MDNLHVVWGMDFLPDGRMLLTERLPGALRILDKNNVLSPPLQEVMSVAAGKEIVLLDVAVDPALYPQSPHLLHLLRFRARADA